MEFPPDIKEKLELPETALLAEEDEPNAFKVGAEPKILELPEIAPVEVATEPKGFELNGAEMEEKVLLVLSVVENPVSILAPGESLP